MKSSLKKGFTLLEILLVVALISILAGIVIIAINPSKQISDTQDAQRRVDVNTIVNAVYQYSVDHQGAMPTGITSTAKEICKVGVACTGVDLSADLASTTAKNYITSIPSDPTTTTTGTGYDIVKDPNTERITVSSIVNNTIKVSR